MTRHIPQTCTNCYARYLYQASGHGCSVLGNDGKYCPRCKLNIHEALARVPATARHDTVEVTGDEKQRVLNEYESQEKETELKKNDSWFGRIREVGDSLFRFDGKKVVASMSSKVVRMNGFKYQIQTWSDNSEPLKVVKSGLRDFDTGELRQLPWKP